MAGGKEEKDWKEGGKGRSGDVMTPSCPGFGGRGEI